jgi:hypothetical protein
MVTALRVLGPQGGFLRFEKNIRSSSGVGLWRNQQSKNKHPTKTHK